MPTGNDSQEGSVHGDWRLITWMTRIWQWSNNCMEVRAKKCVSNKKGNIKETTIKPIIPFSHTSGLLAC